MGVYSGLPFVFSFERIGFGCGAISKGCVAAIGQRAVWWSTSGFWLYDGAIQPLESDVWDFLRLDVNAAQRSKVTSFHNSAHGEVWWFYPSASSSEVDRYVYWDYRRNHWGKGSLARLGRVRLGVQPGGRR